MSDKNWTPGPWRGCKKGECSCGQIWSVPHDHPVAKVEWDKWGDSYPSVRLTSAEGSIGVKAEAYMELVEYGSIPIDKCKANARLIAAAPELYEALEIMADMMWPKGFESVTGLADRSAWDKASTALKKARGES